MIQLKKWIAKSNTKDMLGIGSHLLSQHWDIVLIQWLIGWCHKFWDSSTTPIYHESWNRAHNLLSMIELGSFQLSLARVSATLIDWNAFGRKQRCTSRLSYNLFTQQVRVLFTTYRSYFRSTLSSNYLWPNLSI